MEALFSGVRHPDGLLQASVPTGSNNPWSRSYTPSDSAEGNFSGGKSAALGVAKWGQPEKLQGRGGASEEELQMTHGTRG